MATLVDFGEGLSDVKGRWVGRKGNGRVLGKFVRIVQVFVR